MQQCQRMDWIEMYEFPVNHGVKGYYSTYVPCDVQSNNVPLKVERFRKTFAS